MHLKEYFVDVLAAQGRLGIPDLVIQHSGSGGVLHISRPSTIYNQGFCGAGTRSCWIAPTRLVRPHPAPSEAWIQGTGDHLGVYVGYMWGICAVGSWSLEKLCWFESDLFTSLKFNQTQFNQINSFRFHSIQLNSIQFASMQFNLI